MFHDQQADWSDVAMVPGGMTWMVGRAVLGGPKVLKIESGSTLLVNISSPGTEQALTAVWGANHSQIWVAGDPDGAEQAYVGYWDHVVENWQLEFPGCKVGLTDLWDDGTTLFAVGEAGTVLSRPLGL